MKAHLTKLSLALLSTVFLLGCQDLGSEPVGPEGLGPEGLGPEFTHNDAGKVHGGPKGGGNGDGGGDGGGGGSCHCDFVNVVLDGWMITDPPNLINQMELVRKLGIMKIRANTEKHGTKFLEFAINMPSTLATFTLGNLDENLAALRNKCEWSGRVEQTLENETWVVTFLLPLIILNSGPKERSVLVKIDESALVETPTGSGVFVGVSDDNRMGVFPGFRVRGSPTVTVEGDRGGDFTATFSGGHIDMRGIPPDERNQIILKCDISDGDDITFDVKRQTS